MWNSIHNEYLLTEKYLAAAAIGQNELMSDYPVEQLSILMREEFFHTRTTICHHQDPRNG
jgi:phosphoenolpyruvate carboxylase